MYVEKAMAPHSSALAWKILWTEEPSRLQSMGSQRVGYDWATSLSLFTFMHWRRKCQPTQCSCLENPRDGGAWWAAVHWVAQSQTRLKRLSSSSSRIVWMHHVLFIHSLVYRHGSCFNFWLLWITLLWAFAQKLLDGHTFSFLLDGYPWVNLLVTGLL